LILARQFQPAPVDDQHGFTPGGSQRVWHTKTARYRIESGECANLSDQSTTKKVRFSVMLPLFVDPNTPSPYQRTFDFARRVDELGYHMGTFGHHSFAPEIGDPSAPFALLSAVAMHTKRLKLGTGVYLAPLHHPVTLAEQAATLDQISGGRAVLGVGIGYRPNEYQGFDLDFGTRAARLEEALQIIRTGWSSGRFEFDGKHFQIPPSAVHPHCVQHPHVPILVGGSAPAAIRRAARLGDGWFALPQESLDVMQEQVETYRRACREYGREPYVCLMRNAWIAPTLEQVEAEWMPKMIEFHKTFSDARASKDDVVIERLLAGESFAIEEYIRARAIAGTPQMCIDEIVRWQAAIQPDEYSLIFGGSDDQLRLTQAVEQFAEQVMVAF
jgi:probable F420-dependent oxidoreductase